MPLKIGKKHVEVVKAFTPSLMTFGGAGGLALLYLTDWKAVLQYVPFYNTKFEPKE